MKNYFSKNLYIQGLKKIKISGVAFSLIIILLNAFLPIIGIIDSSHYSREYAPQLVNYNMVVPFCMLILVLVPILAHDMFGFMNERHQSDFYHAIPHKRSCVYISFTAAILTWAFGTVVASALVNTVLWSLASHYTFTFSSIILGTLPYLVLSVMMAGVMILAMTVTGTRISNFLVAILFFLFVRVMGALSVIALSEITPVLNVDYTAFKFFNIEFFLPFALFQGLFDNDAGVFADAKLQLYSLFVGILFLVLGGIAYNKRRSESATKSAPSKLLQHLYRFAVTLPFAFLVAFFIMMEGIEGYQIILVLIAFLVYVLYELITTKKLKSVIKSLPWLFVPVLVTVLMVSGLYITRNHINNDRFEPDEMAGFSFVQNYSTSYEKLNTESIFVADEEAAEILAEALEDTIDRNYGYNSNAVYERVLIKLKSGRVLARNLYIHKINHDKLEQTLINSPEYSEAYIKLPNPREVLNVALYGHYGLDREDIIELYKSFYDEYNKLSYADKVKVKYPQGEYSSVVQIGVSGYYNHNKYDSTYHIIFEQMPITATKYLDMVSETYAYGEFGSSIDYTYTNLKRYAEEAEKGNLDYIYGSISLSKIVGKFDDGSIEKIYKGEEPAKISALRDIFALIIADEGSFVYDDPEKIYNLHYYLDVGLKEGFDSRSSSDYAETTAAYPATEQVVVEEPEVSAYFYFNDDMFVSISDENIQKIIDILENTNSQK